MTTGEAALFWYVVLVVGGFMFYTFPLFTLGLILTLALLSKVLK